MYRAFNLAPFLPNDDYVKTGRELVKTARTRARSALAMFLEGGKLDATKLGGHWFPNVNADVFISHSHKDESVALGIAGWLHEIFGISSFVDSAVWGNSADLLKEIDDAHCINPGGETYSYESRNKSTSHVHMILATALAKTIDRTECVIFVNSHNSITPGEAVSAKTYSPWIFYELAMIRLVERKSADSHRSLLKESQFSAKSAVDETLFQYDADLSGMCEISVDDLKAWESQSLIKKTRYPLDSLYRLQSEY